MLKLASNGDAGAILEFCRREPLGVRISCLSRAYGLEGRMLSVWLQQNDEKKITAVVADYCGNVTFICGDECDGEELGLFLGASPFRSLCSSKGGFELCGLEADEEKRLFALEGGAEHFEGVKDDGDIRAMYELVSKSIPNSFEGGERAFLEFLSDYTYRKNRGLARLRTVSDGKKILAVCFTAAEDDERALISAVASSPAARGRGFGRAVVSDMAASLKEEGKAPFVIALNDEAGSFYEHIGFVPCGTVDYKYRKNNNE